MDRTPPHSDFHHAGLIVWLLMALLPSALTSNPWYLLWSGVLLFGLHRATGQGSETANAWAGFAYFALAFVVFTLLMNILFGGLGQTVLLELPAWRPGDGSFQVGGPVTLEGILHGLISALALLCAIFALATFNTLVDHYQLLRSVPRFLHQAATVASIAIVFLPQMARAQREIRQAHALRGHRIRGLRDLGPLLLTLLYEALERAMRLAESMEARGFGASHPRSLSQGLGTRLAIVLALGLLLVGVVVRGMGADMFEAVDLPWDHQRLGSVAIGVGMALLGGALWSLGRRQRRTHHRRTRWRRRDSALVAVSLLAAAFFVGLKIRQPSLFNYQTLPKAQWPTFEWWIALPMLLVLCPQVLRRQSLRAQSRPTAPAPEEVQ